MFYGTIKYLALFLISSVQNLLNIANVCISSKYPSLVSQIEECLYIQSTVNFILLQEKKVFYDNVYCKSNLYVWINEYTNIEIIIMVLTL